MVVLRMMPFNGGEILNGGQNAELREKGLYPTAGDESTAIKFATLNCWYARPYTACPPGERGGRRENSLTNLEL